MQDRQNLLIAMCAMGIAGLLLFLFARKEPAPSPVIPDTPAAGYSDEADQFRRAIEKGDTVTMRQLLDGGVVKAYGEMSTGRGWLQYAVQRGHIDACALLIEKGASPTHADGVSSVAIDLAKRSGDPELIALMSSPAAPVGNSGDAPATSDNLLGQLERLAALRTSGHLNETEFAAAKSRLLGTASWGA